MNKLQSIYLKQDNLLNLFAVKTGSLLRPLNLSGKNKNSSLPALKCFLVWQSYWPHVGMARTWVIFFSCARPLADSWAWLRHACQHTDLDSNLRCFITAGCAPTFLIPNMHILLTYLWRNMWLHYLSMSLLSPTGFYTWWAARRADERTNKLWFDFRLLFLWDFQGRLVKNQPTPVYGT